MFKNKHIIAALIITPILSVLGYFAVDALVSETPHAATPGNSYELVARSNCRYASGRCELVNGAFKVAITGEPQTNRQLELTLTSEFPLQGGKVAIASHTATQPVPVELQPADNNLRNWQAQLSLPVDDGLTLQLALSADSSLYFGEAPLSFLEYRTSFGEDFRAVEHKGAGQ